MFDPIGNSKLTQKNLEGSLNISRCFTAANFDGYFIVRRNALKDQWEIMGTEESKMNGNLSIYFKSLYLYAYLITSAVDFA
jgi:hypothetical protein